LWKEDPLWERSPDRDLEIAPTYPNRRSPPQQAIPRVVVEDSRIILCNAAAIAADIVPGSTLATAHSIASGLCHYRRSPGQEARRLRRLAEVLYRFSSQVSLAPPGSLVMEVGASLKLFGGIETLTRAVAALCQELGHRVACRNAETPLAALTLARAGTPALAEAPLCLAAIEPTQLSPGVIEQLGNMGVHTIGQLLELPAAGLAARFGQGLVDYLQRLSGARPDPRRYLQPAARFRRQLHLLSPLRSKDAMLGPMAQLLTELQHWLVAHQLGVEQLRWQFVAAGRDAPPVALSVLFTSGQQRQARLFDISRLELERAVLPEEVISMSLRAERLRPWQTGSQALFRYLSPGSPAAESVDRPGRKRARGRSAAGAGSDVRLSAGQLAELGELVDQLEARLGRGACWSLQVLDQHVPEAAWQSAAPLRAAARPSGDRRPPLTASRAPGRATRPAWLFEPPRAVDPGQLTVLRGPERIETGWWRVAPVGPTGVGAISRSRSLDYSCNRDREIAPTPAGNRDQACSDRQAIAPTPDGDRDQACSDEQAIAPTGNWRDYYVARHENGAECWVFTDAGANWYLHGYFG